MFWRWRRRRLKSKIQMHPVVVQMTVDNARSLVRWIEGEKMQDDDIEIVSRLHQSLRNAIDMDGIVLQTWINLHPMTSQEILEEK